ncbi:hypothetical protein L0B53_18925 (plasmid) [Vibrio sp. SS-MA-C1-2]|uniref:hypothetical protein n=1 Tax=Vibrio sp. SS-MA-C1-2 TaxID=2908646 RepID=UPI001F2CE03C|nr:hypothetical protein [Vibrio sp. SS-MA-C1-2]UJF20210.1 hypothetical protein L0B53_18925 [Vibrio sp. SS-MA-C1-2]
MMKTTSTTLAILFSLSVFAAQEEETIYQFESIPPAKIDNSLVRQIQTDLVKAQQEHNEEALSHSILHYYSHVIPALRYNSVVLNNELSTNLYIIAHDASINYIKLRLSDSNKWNMDEYQFLKKIAIDDALEGINKIQLNLDQIVSMPQGGQDYVQ